jgi:OmpA-OmpF porin, OOP family
MRTTRFFHGLCGALAAAAVLGAGADASAQPKPPLALDRFDPAPAGDRMFGVPSPFAAGDPGVHVMVLGDYAHDPLVLRTKKDDKTIGAIVSSQLFLHLDATVALWNRLAVNVDVPVAVFQGGDSPTGAGQPFPSPTKAQFGDLRLGARVRLLGQYHDAFQLAVGGYLWLPTGADSSFVSDKKVRGLPQIIAGGRTNRLVWSAMIGPEFRPSQAYAGVSQSSMIRFGAGLGVLLGEDRQFQVGPELSTALTLDGVNANTTNAEILLDGRWRFLPDFEAGVGVGPGLSSGIGTPDVRVIAMIAYTPEQKKPDRDKDGIIDEVDACPDVPGVPSEDKAKHGCPLPADRDKDGILDKDDACVDEPGIPDADPRKNGCPPPKDRDHDGILDKDDACIDEPGLPSDDKTKNGCPPPKDRDGDGIVDAEDACPDLKGVRSADPAQNGCPPDTDGDTIRDDKDACPNEKGPADPNPKKNGCPTVHVTETEIIILEQVQFDTSKSTIKKVSDPLLDKVATVFKDHLEIARVEVQGHTDNKGNAKANKKLSQDRAEAVKKALVKRGIKADRLISKGYGQDVPIASNDTDEGRQDNRRVQFKILEKAPKKQP